MGHGGGDMGEGFAGRYPRATNLLWALSGSLKMFSSSKENCGVLGVVLFFFSSLIIILCRQFYA